ncbi:MAG TPA: galactokinase [Actinomycetota bacterium]|nr:galactokinase [Actinomycetota bacterium]
MTAVPTAGDALERARAAAGPRARAWRAPGRANLIGEHTDYNDGLVLPVALDMATCVAGTPGGDVVRLRSLEEPGDVVVDVATGRGPERGWGRYARAVVRALRDDGVAVRGFDGVVASDVPVGSGLSSSAALEVALAHALADDPLDPLRIATICRRAENVYVGVECGIMDQLASAAGVEGHALLIDCRTNEVEPVPLPPAVRVLLVDSGTARGLSDGEYNARRAQCERAAAALGVRSLRDATPAGLDARRGDMDEGDYRRARHVVTENERVRAAAAALRAGRLDALGDLFDAAHRSLAADFDVSLPELDALVEAAAGTPGVLGARLTGAGFGGCTVNLVDAAAAEDAAAAVLDAYEAATGRRTRAWLSGAATGAGPVDA